MFSVIPPTAMQELFLFLDTCTHWFAINPSACVVIFELVVLQNRQRFWAFWDKRQDWAIKTLGFGFKSYPSSEIAMNFGIREAKIVCIQTLFTNGIPLKCSSLEYRSAS
jgi:hypothetical protein